VKITIYVARHRHEYLSAIGAARARPVRWPPPADPWAGTDAGPAKVLIGADAIAVIDR